MSDQGLRKALQAMHAGGVHPRAIAVFEHYYRELESGATGMIAEADIDPLVNPPRLVNLHIDTGVARQALAQTAVIKLNGGLGTSMGMDRAKSLLPVRDDRTFLDLIVEQVRRVRADHGVALPLILMNSFHTREDSLAALSAYPDLQVPGLPLDFLQNRQPKLRADDLTPVRWPADPSMEWCPPGHGDLYTALEVSGLLQSLLDAGYRYASVSNSDNLGAAPEPSIVGWFASSGVPYAAEVCARTPADRKGGHLAVRKSDGRLVLRDTAQTSKEDLAAFISGERHAYFHTNNLWFDLLALSKALSERDGVLGLPLIRNVKTVDPADPSSPEIIQIETAMGAAIEVFDGAVALEVPRSRFLPVKTTNDLLLVRSDVYHLDDKVRLQPTVQQVPLVTLGRRSLQDHHRLRRPVPGRSTIIARRRVPHVQGDWTFGAGVLVRGDAKLETPRAAARLEAGTVLGD
jgi:UTP--glucose-1-phosphate uridylyltransferase